MITTEIRKRFIKDYSIPISIVEDPYWDYFCNLYNDLYNIEDKLKMLENDITKNKGEVLFIENMLQTRNMIVSTLKSTKEFKEFTSESNSDFSINGKYTKINLMEENEDLGVKFLKNHTDVYSSENDGKDFVSIDLKKANFQALKYYNPNLVFNSLSYENLISKFTDMQYLKESKYLRQVIFGTMNPSRQIQIEKYITSEILNCLLKTKTINPTDVYVYTNDEIVLFANYDKEKINNTIKEFLPNIDLHITKFHLVKLLNKDFYVKELDDGTVKFKKVPSIYFAQVYKKYLGQEINKNDLTFLYEGQLATFNKNIFE